MRSLRENRFAPKPCPDFAIVWALLAQPCILGYQARQVLNKLAVTLALDSRIADGRIICAQVDKHSSSVGQGSQIIQDADLRRQLR